MSEPEWTRVRPSLNQNSMIDYGIADIQLMRESGVVQVDLCPMVAILAYVAVRPVVSGPLFVFKDVFFLTRDRLVSAIRRALCTAEVDTKGYSAPSFQIGAAKTAALVGIKHSTIKMLGRWESSAHQRYLRTPRESLAAISTRHIVHSSVIICIYWGRVVQLCWWYPCLGVIV